MCDHSNHGQKFLHDRIIIIGAGVSGLSCASRLKHKGFTDVCILEANTDVGGRTRTIHFGEYFIELGAQWIHGQKNNAIYELALKQNLLNENCPDYFEAFNKFKYLTPNDSELVSNLYEFLEQQLTSISPSDCLKYDFVSYLDRQVKNFIEKYNYEDEIEKVTEAHELFCKLLCELNGCNDVADLSLKLYNIYKECEGNQCVEIKNGYSSILRCILENIPSSWIKTNSKVVQIDWTAFDNNQECSKGKFSKYIKVTCDNGSIYTADHVISTVSLGYLKKHAKSLFVPALNETKLKAIDAIGFGAVNKIFLEYEQPFWDDPAIFITIWKNKTRASVKHFISKNNWTGSISRVTYCPGHPKMICAWISGPGAKAAESFSDEKVTQDLTMLLENTVGHSIPMPTCIYRSNWFSDEFACGSYSFPSTLCDASETSCFQDLAEPVCAPNSSHPVIMFAGEATHSYFYSTVHGAYESGIREADRIYQHYQNATVEKVLSEGQVPINIESKIVIIGAGLAGLASALHLTKSGFKNILILEASPRIGGRVLTFQHDDKVLDLGAQWIHGKKNPLFEFAHQNKLLLPHTETLSHEGIGVFCTSSGKKVEDGIVKQVKDIVNSAKTRLEEGLFGIRQDKSVLEFLTEAFETYTKELEVKSKSLKCLCVDFEKTEGLRSSPKNLSDRAKDILKSQIEGVEYCDIWKEATDWMGSEGWKEGSFESYLKKLGDSGESQSGGVDLKTLRRSIFDWCIKYEMIDNACDNLDNVAIQSFHEWDECPDEYYHIDFKKGFGSVLESIQNQIPDVILKLNCPVVSIQWDNEIDVNSSSKCYPVTIKCANGDEYQADSVIVTPSVGFLKENPSFFDPPLPRRKVEALDTIAFGTVNKFFLVYEEPFWTSDDVGFQLLWTEKNEKCKKLLQENPWIKGITGFDVMLNYPNVLRGWIGGEEAKMSENVSEKTISSVCTEILRVFLDRPDISEPGKVFRSQWCNDPYIRGAYSSRTLRYYQNDSTLQDLKSPLFCTYKSKSENAVKRPIVLFAGEAYDEKSFSSAHGAFQSGLETAETLIQANKGMQEY